MGDRYSITAEATALAARYALDVPERYQPHYNAAPTQILPVITQGSGGFSHFYWGQIPERSNNRSITKKLILTQVEGLSERTNGRTALSSHRCIIPADGIYDWKQVSKKGRIPYRITWRDGKIFSMGGIWEEFDDEEGNLVHTFRILTTPANSALSDINNRMPLIISKEDEDRWLSASVDASGISSLLKTYDNTQFYMYTVSPRVADASYDHPSLVKPFSAADQFGNYSLFD
jgi:putative SOS response-associated peptidase YedK